MLNELIQYLTSKPDLTNAVATVASAVIALASLVVSGVSLYVAHRTLAVQHSHNVLSVRPLPSISPADYEQRITVKLFNDGTGPLLIKRLYVHDGDKEWKSLVDSMPTTTPSIDWSTFTGTMVDRSLPAGGVITLLALEGNEVDPTFRSFRDECRQKLASLTIKIQYTDIYHTVLPEYSKGLGWFGRHFSTGVSKDSRSDSIEIQGASKDLAVKGPR